MTGAQIIPFPTTHSQEKTPRKEWSLEDTAAMYLTAEIMAAGIAAGNRCEPPASPDNHLYMKGYAIGQGGGAS